MSDLHYHACPLCYRHAPCRMDCHIEPDLSGDRPTGHTTPCDECSKPAPIATADLPAALRGYAGDGSIEPVDAPASLLLRAADALDCASPVAEAHVGGLWVLAYAAPCGGLDVVAYSSPRLAQCPFAARWRDGRWWGVVGAFGGREVKRAVERWVEGVRRDGR